MKLCKGFVCNETLLMRHASRAFRFLGGQLPVTCERCDICTVTGEGTPFWNTVRHSFTINLVLAVFLREVPIRTYVMSNTTNQFVTSEGKRSIDGQFCCGMIFKLVHFNCSM